MRTLEQRRIDAKIIKMSEIMHDLVAVPVLLPHFEQLEIDTAELPHFALRQIHATANYYKFAFSRTCLLELTSTHIALLAGIYEFHTWSFCAGRKTPITGLFELCVIIVGFFAHICKSLVETWTCAEIPEGAGVSSWKKGHYAS